MTLASARAFVIATADHRIPLRVTGEFAPSQEIAFASGGAREDFGPNLLRGGGRGANQRDVEGHEHHCVGS